MAEVWKVLFSVPPWVGGSYLLSESHGSKAHDIPFGRCNAALRHFAIPRLTLRMNATLVKGLVAHCKTVVTEKLASEDMQSNSNGTATDNGGVPPYDSAYFYILVVMFFYSFLALTLFRSFPSQDKGETDPNEEFSSSAEKYDPGSLAEKFNIGEESP